MIAEGRVPVDDGREGMWKWGVCREVGPRTMWCWGSTSGGWSEPFMVVKRG